MTIACPSRAVLRAADGHDLGEAACTEPLGHPGWHRGPALGQRWTDEDPWTTRRPLGTHPLDS